MSFVATTTLSLFLSFVLSLFLAAQPIVPATSNLHTLLLPPRDSRAIKMSAPARASRGASRTNPHFLPPHRIPVKNTSIENISKTSRSPSCFTKNIYTYLSDSDIFISIGKRNTFLFIGQTLLVIIYFREIFIVCLILMRILTSDISADRPTSRTRAPIVENRQLIENDASSVH